MESPNTDFRTVPSNVLDDLCCRFIINVPEEERKDLIRLCFQVELAHWFYIDFYCKNAKKTIGIKEFAHQIFKHIPSLHQYLKDVDKIIDEWKEYKYLVPTFGAILLNEDLSYVLLVQSLKSSWGFPKGKVNKDEPPWGCAIREVYEETGFNIRDMINPYEYLDATVNDQLVRLYIIPGVSQNSKFQPMTRNEIKSVQWFSLNDLPSKKDNGYRIKGPTGTESFYMISPFIRRLRQWIFEQRNKPPRKSRRQRHSSCGDLDDLAHKDYPCTKYLKNIKDMSELKRDNTFKPLEIEKSTSPSEEEVRNSPENKKSSDMEKLLIMFPKLNPKDTKFNWDDSKNFERRNSSGIEVRSKQKSLKLASFLKAFEHSRSCSVPPLSPFEKIQKRRVRRKMSFDSLGETESGLIPISETEKIEGSKTPLKFNEICLSESIVNYGIYNWCNFKFDIQSILNCIDEIK